MTFPPLLFLCFHLLAQLHKTSVAALSSHIPQAMHCSTSGNYTSGGAYSANLNKFLASLPEKTVSRNGGFFNATVGEGMGTVYGLAMCSADQSRSDCGDCLAATASSNANGLPNRCRGSTTVLAWFDACLVRYSDINFFGTAELGSVYTLNGLTAREPLQYRDEVDRSFEESIGAAAASPQRFAASSTHPYTLVQCTWDLPPAQCKDCLNVLSASGTMDWISMKLDGKRRSYSCAVRYGNTSFMVVPFGGGPTPQYVDQTAKSATQSSGGKGSLAIGLVGSVVGIILLACLAALIRYVQYLQRRQNTKGHVRRFTYQQLKAATRDFADIQVLGQGGFGTVYKGVIQSLPDKEGNQKELFVAIKKNTHARSDEAMKAFNNEIDIMSPLNHCNIIRLLGWCDDKQELFLVYELAEDLNLEARLSASSGLILDWPMRYKILKGMAAGLEYLHTKCEKTVMHRDIKPGNVMLDKNFNAKLCDFGLVTQLTHAVTSRSTGNIIGTKGYMDPLFEEKGKVLRESDVYSFGVVMLEVICGVKPGLIMIDRETKNTLVEMVREYRNRNAILDAAHQHLRGRFDDQIKGALLIGLNCVERSRSDRPTIEIVFSNLSSLCDSYVML